MLLAWLWGAIALSNLGWVGHSNPAASDVIIQRIVDPYSLGTLPIPMRQRGFILDFAGNPAMGCEPFLFRGMALSSVTHINGASAMTGWIQFEHRAEVAQGGGLSPRPVP